LRQSRNLGPKRSTSRPAARRLTHRRPVHRALDDESDHTNFLNHCPTGKSVRLLSSPSSENIPLLASPKSPLYPPPSHPLDEGRIAIVTDVGMGCGGRGGVARACGCRVGFLARERSAARRRATPCPTEPFGEDGWLRTAKPCGPGTRCWCQVGGGASAQPGLDKPSIRWRRRQDEFVSGESSA
jgi:hypothetical protein